MTNKVLADLITRGLREGLTHPGREGGQGIPILLPQFRTGGMPKEMVELADETATLLGEAIVNLIETEAGVELIPQGEAEQLREQALERGSTRVVSIHCRCDRERANPLAILTVTNSPAVVVDGEQLINGLTSRSPKCPHGRV